MSHHFAADSTRWSPMSPRCPCRSPIPVSSIICGCTFTCYRKNSTGGRICPRPTRQCGCRCRIADSDSQDVRAVRGMVRRKKVRAPGWSAKRGSAHQSGSRAAVGITPSRNDARTGTHFHEPFAAASPGSTTVDNLSQSCRVTVARVVQTGEPTSPFSWASSQQVRQGDGNDVHCGDGPCVPRHDKSLGHHLVGQSNQEEPVHHHDRHN